MQIAGRLLQYTAGSGPPPPRYGAGSSGAEGPTRPHASPPPPRAPVAAFQSVPTARSAVPTCPLSPTMGRTLGVEGPLPPPGPPCRHKAGAGRDR